MNEEIIRAIENQQQSLIELRRQFHQIPELGFQERKTSRKIEDYLNEMGLTVTSGVADTGVVALLTGQQAKRTILYRADIDGLPIQEENNVPYRSQHPGIMHACGHDAHIAMALMTAKILANFKDQLKGNVKFVFQPAEEIVDGAKKMIEAGVLKNPPVDAAIGFHVWNDIPAGKIGIKTGPVMATVNHLNVIITGNIGHGAMPYQGRDSIVAAADFIQQVQNIITRKLDPRKNVVISFGKINGGYVRNTVGGTVKLEGTIRTFDKVVIKKIDGELRKIAEALAIIHGVEIKVQNRETATAVVNDPNMTDLARKAAEQIVGGENIIEIEPLMGSEDMSEFLNKVPGCYLLIGSGNEAGKFTPPHHNSKFDINEKCLGIGVRMAVSLIWLFLNEV